MSEQTPAFTQLPNLASRALAASVVHANDELFAEKENLIKPEPATFVAGEFGHKGKTYDGWETRRRREPGHDHAIVRLGVPGVVHGVVVDTSWFTGNYPPHVSVEATSAAGYPSPAELERAEWTTLVPKSRIGGDRENWFDVDDDRRFTHVRLSIHPDGGVARFRVYGVPVPDPRLLTGTVDLAALEHGAGVVACSDMFYGSPVNLLLPGRAANMGEGWENARRRDDSNDFVTVRLAGRGRVRRVEVDTSWFVGNAPGWVSLRGLDAGPFEDGSPEPDLAAVPADSSVELVPRTPLQPDTRHFFRVAGTAPVTHIRMDVYPDGGVARLRVHGELEPAALEAATLRWLDALPEPHAVQVLAGDAGVSPAEAERLAGARPFAGGGVLPEPVVRRLLDG